MYLIYCLKRWWWFCTLIMILHIGQFGYLHHEWNIYIPSCAMVCENVNPSHIWYTWRQLLGSSPFYIPRAQSPVSILRQSFPYIPYIDNANALELQQFDVTMAVTSFVGRITFSSFVTFNCVVDTLCDLTGKVSLVFVLISHFLSLKPMNSTYSGTPRGDIISTFKLIRRTYEPFPSLVT